MSGLRRVPLAQLRVWALLKQIKPDDLRETAARKNLKTAEQLRGALAERLSEFFVEPALDIFDDTPSCVLFVGINGAGKTTTVGKIASAEAHAGKKDVYKRQPFLYRGEQHG